MLFNGRALIFTFSRTQVRIAEIERLQSFFKDEVTRENRSAILFNSRFQDDVHFQKKKKKIIAPVRQLLRAPYVASRDNILFRCLLEH